MEHSLRQRLATEYIVDDAEDLAECSGLPRLRLYKLFQPISYLSTLEHRLPSPRAFYPHSPTIPALILS